MTRVVPGEYPKGPGCYVYALCEPDSREIRYVGITCRTVHYRVRGHLNSAEAGNKSYKDNWVRKLMREGKLPYVIVLEIVVHRDQLADRERFWIKTCREDGHRLTNIGTGGQGTAPVSETTRAKLRGRSATNTLKQRAATSAALKLMWADGGVLRERANRIRAARPLKMQGEELRQWRRAQAIRMGHGNQGIVRSPELRARIAEGVRRAHAEGRGRWSKTS